MSKVKKTSFLVRSIDVKQWEACKSAITKGDHTYRAPMLSEVFRAFIKQIADGTIKVNNRGYFSGIKFELKE